MNTYEVMPLIDNLAHLYYQFTAAHYGVEPNAWLMHPAMWQRVREEAQRYRTTLAFDAIPDLTFAWREGPTVPLLSRFGDPPALITLPVYLTTALPDNVIRAAHVGE